MPVRDMLLNPPPDLRHDLSLTEVGFGEAIWLRLLGGQGSVFANSDLPEPERRYHMAGALFTALCATAGGRAVGLPPVPNDEMKAQMDLFARRLLHGAAPAARRLAGHAPGRLGPVVRRAGERGRNTHRPTRRLVPRGVRRAPASVPTQRPGSHPRQTGGSV
ncbi:MAG: hypothetical protein V9F04_16845 [Dermatophilaceae bacterium]